MDKLPSPEKTIPSSIHAEQLLIGVILLNNDVMNRIEDFLKPEHFYHLLHNKIYKAMHSIFEKGLPISIATLESMLRNIEELAEVGGINYLASLSTMAISAVDPYSYAKIIHDLAMRRNLIEIGTGMIHTAYEADLTNTSLEQIANVEAKLFDLASTGTIGKGFLHLDSSLKDSIINIDLARHHPNHITGITTGFIDLDKKLAGLHNSDFIIIAGRPSMGKTALATNLALNAGVQLTKGKQNIVGFFSLEMSSEQLATRMISIRSGIDTIHLKTGNVREEQYNLLRKEADILANTKLFIDDTPALSLASIRTRARRLKRQHGLDILFIDYLQLIRPNTNQNNRVLEISEITQGLKAIAKELNIPVIALSQLSRAVEQRQDRRPMLSDLRESGTIEQDADVVMFIYREEYYLSRSTPEVGSKEYEKWQQRMNEVRNTSEIIIAKHRNGPIGNIQLHYNDQFAKFDNAASKGPL